MVDFAQARRTMVDGQLRTFDVNDMPLLDAMDTVPRELFVLPGRQDLAYIDQDILVSDGAERRYMLSPMILGRMIQALAIEAGERVLDVACGRGYASADGVTVVTGPLDEGYAGNAPYDAILINGSVEVRPEALLGQLAEGGRLVCVIGRGRAAQATVYVRSGDALGERSLFEAAAPMLTPFLRTPGFTF